MAVHYTLSYTDGNNIADKKPLGFYRSISDCIHWADKHDVAYYLLVITEWDGEEITAQVNLDAPVNDNHLDDLSKYIV